VAFLLACVASVSVGVSAGLKHLSLFERAKIGASAKKTREKGEGISPDVSEKKTSGTQGSVKGAFFKIMGFAGKRFLFSPPSLPLPLPDPSISVALAPIFGQPKSLRRLPSSTPG